MLRCRTVSLTSPRLDQTLKNMYYNYYATQVIHHWGGEEWQQMECRYEKATGFQTNHRWTGDGQLESPRSTCQFRRPDLPDSVEPADPRSVLPTPADLPAARELATTRLRRESTMTGSTSRGAATVANRVSMDSPAQQGHRATAVFCRTKVPLVRSHSPARCGRYWVKKMHRC